MRAEESSNLHEILFTFRFGQGMSDHLLLQEVMTTESAIVAEECTGLKG